MEHKWGIKVWLSDDDNDWLWVTEGDFQNTQPISFSSFEEAEKNRRDVWGRSKRSQTAPLPNLELEHEFVSSLEENEDGDLMVTLPPELLGKMGWSLETKLYWHIDDDGKVYISDQEERT